MRVWSVWVRGRRRRRGARLEVWKDPLEGEEDEVEFDVSRLQISLILLFSFLGFSRNVMDVVFWVCKKIAPLFLLY
jgi:hypothetical protein